MTSYLKVEAPASDWVAFDALPVPCVFQAQGYPEALYVKLRFGGLYLGEHPHPLTDVHGLSPHEFHHPQFRECRVVNRRIELAVEAPA